MTAPSEEQRRIGHTVVGEDPLRRATDAVARNRRFVMPLVVDDANRMSAVHQSYPDLVLLRGARTHVPVSVLVITDVEAFQIQLAHIHDGRYRPGMLVADLEDIESYDQVNLARFSPYRYRSAGYIRTAFVPISWDDTDQVSARFRRSEGVVSVRVLSSIEDEVSVGDVVLIGEDSQDREIRDADIFYDAEEVPEVHFDDGDLTERPSFWFAVPYLHHASEIIYVPAHETPNTDLHIDMSWIGQFNSRELVPVRWVGASSGATKSEAYMHGFRPSPPVCLTDREATQLRNGTASTCLRNKATAAMLQLTDFQDMVALGVPELEALAFAFGVHTSHQPFLEEDLVSEYYDVESGPSALVT